MRKNVASEKSSREKECKKHNNKIDARHKKTVKDKT
jgi:hypothetical protein